MVRRIDDESLQAIEAVVSQQPGGMTAPEISDAMDSAVPRRTLQYRLKSLVDDKRLVRNGSGRWARYHFPKVTSQSARVGTGSPRVSTRLATLPPLSEDGSEIRNHVRQRATARQPVGYDRNFLDCYRPNVSFYLTDAERTELHDLGKTGIVEQPAGTYAKTVLNRLLIDLSWNSCRLEGNTYSLLDTVRLIEFGEEADGQESARNADGPQSQGGHRDPGRFCRGYRFQPSHDPQPARRAGGQPSRRPRGAGTTPAFRSWEFRVRSIIPWRYRSSSKSASKRFWPRRPGSRIHLNGRFSLLVQLPYLQPFDNVNKRTLQTCGKHSAHSGRTCPRFLSRMCRGSSTRKRFSAFMNSSALICCATFLSGRTGGLLRVTLQCVSRSESPTLFDWFTVRRYALSLEMSSAGA